jgi:hypothetical protein
LRVELRYAPLPFIGAIAVHYWFVVYGDDGSCHRWEVWQTKNAGGTSYGHVHCDLKTPEAGVGGGPARLAAEWRGEEALRIAAVLAEPEIYPHGQRYRYWPGPNSNSFVAWVLARADIEYALHWRGIGRKWRS